MGFKQDEKDENQLKNTPFHKMFVTKGENGEQLEENPEEKKTNPKKLRSAS
jgi:hypothetical protein